MNIANCCRTHRWVAGSLALAGPERILVADDDETTLDAITTELVDHGHEVVGLQDGEQLVECLDIIERDGLRAPDLIAMDVYMPGRSGIELLEGLRSAGWLTPVVLFTSFVSSDLCRRAETAGSAAVIQKPFDLTKLRNAARRARHELVHSGSR
jgi:CheY-like chemotaxis protein